MNLFIYLLTYLLAYFCGLVLVFFNESFCRLPGDISWLQVTLFMTESLNHSFKHTDSLRNTSRSVVLLGDAQQLCWGFNWNSFIWRIVSIVSKCKLHNINFLFILNCCIKQYHTRTRSSLCLHTDSTITLLLVWYWYSYFNYVDT